MLVKRLTITVVFAFLVLLPVSASAQRQRLGKHTIQNVDNLYLRDHIVHKVVMGNLFPHDTFYVQEYSASGRWAWGVAIIAGFERCGWVQARFNGKPTLRFENSRQSGIRCSSRYPTKQVKFEDFAWPNSLNPPPPYDNGDPATVILPAGTRINLWANYIVGRTPPYTRRLRFLYNGDQIAWRYTTRDGKYLLVKSRTENGRDAQRFWGFVACDKIKPKRGSNTPICRP
jgi:hypothetical protein